MNKEETAGIAVYKKQRNYIVRLNKESKHNYFDSLDTKKGFKLFRNVYKHQPTTFRKFFSQIVPFLELFKWPEDLPNVPRPLRNYDRSDHN